MVVVVAVALGACGDGGGEEARLAWSPMARSVRGGRGQRANERWTAEELRSRTVRASSDVHWLATQTSKPTSKPIMPDNVATEWDFSMQGTGGG